MHLSADGLHARAFKICGELRLSCVLRKPPSGRIRGSERGRLTILTDFGKYWVRYLRRGWVVDGLSEVEDAGGSRSEGRDRTSEVCGRVLADLASHSPCAPHRESTTTTTVVPRITFRRFKQNVQCALAMMETTFGSIRKHNVVPNYPLFAHIWSLVQHPKVAKNYT